MTAMGIPANAKQLAALVKEGEGPALEFKRSTGELKEGMQTFCAFLNGSGGMVLFGVRPEGTIEGQAVSDQTLRDVVHAADRFEPPAHVSVHRVKLKANREVLALSTDAARDVRPFTYEGRAYERVESTTRRMPQAKYERLLLDRAHGTRRWENEPGEGVELRDIDRDELFRIVEGAKSAGRLIGPVGIRVADVLDRLKLRREGRILQAAVVLFGKEFLPDYPQCELRMARFRGTDKTEFLDQRHVRGPAFKLLEEAQLFCQRHFPLPGKIVPGKLQRVDTPLIPPDAMREILVNALIHRDYAIAGGAISLAIFDDRVEVWSAGTYPTGITPAMLTRQHLSVLRNPIIADIFHRAGLIEQWGRGTNRVIEMCRKAHIAPPVFQEIGPFAAVTFRVRVGATAQVAPHADTESALGRDHEAPSGHQVGTKSGLSQDQVEILGLCREQRTLVELMNVSGRRNRTKFRDSFIKPLLEAGLLVLTVPGKPRSRMQRYRTTEAGIATLAQSITGDHGQRA
jgi:ATP-dependent DNA helicase RecG